MPRLSDTIAINIVDISQVNVDGLIRDVGGEKAMRLLKQVTENNVIILKLQENLMKDGKRKSKEEERKRINDE